MKQLLFLSLLFLVNSLRADDAFAFEKLKTLPPTEDGIVYGDKIRRTMHLLSTSTEDNPNKVKILFFGQSITRQNYSRKIIEASLRKRFPHADLEVLNTAIGGYQAPRSVETMFQTLIPHQPDLVVFHVYGGESDGSYEQILKNIRKLTSAELICVTHHLDNYNEERTRQKDSASELRRELAHKYDAELVDVREQWKHYMKLHDLPVTEFLSDNIHHNVHGGELWGALQERHFKVQKSDPDSWQERVTTIDLKTGKTSGELGDVSFEKGGWELTKKTGLVSLSKDQPLRIRFRGTRVDVVSRRLDDAKADILVDGRKPSEFIETWSATLPSSTPIDYRPAIMRVGLGGAPVKENWTVKFDSVSADGKEFSFQLRGSKSGNQGKGNHANPFRSDNGVIKLDPKMFTLSHAIQIKKKPLETPFSVTWKVENRSRDGWVTKLGNDEPSTTSGQITLVQQLPNDEHVLEIIPRDGKFEIEKILIFRPPGAKSE